MNPANHITSKATGSPEGVIGIHYESELIVILFGGQLLDHLELSVKDARVLADALLQKAEELERYQKRDRQ